MKYNVYLKFKNGVSAGKYTIFANNESDAKKKALKQFETTDLFHHRTYIDLAKSKIEKIKDSMPALDRAIKNMDAPDTIQEELSKKFDKYCEDIYKKAKAENNDKEIKKFVNQLNSEKNKYVKNRWSDTEDIRGIYSTWYHRIVNLKFNLR